MVVKKYKCRLSNRWGCEASIEEVDVDKETAKSVWINGSRYAKISDYSNYYDSWDEAKHALLVCHEYYTKMIRLRLESANSALGNIKDMKS